jgi:hypothetical protein
MTLSGDHFLVLRRIETLGIGRYLIDGSDPRMSQTFGNIGVLRKWREFEFWRGAMGFSVNASCPVACAAVQISWPPLLIMVPLVVPPADKTST